MYIDDLYDMSMLHISYHLIDMIYLMYSYLSYISFTNML